MQTRWQATRADIVTRINNGQWQVGSRLPPEPELAVQLGVSRSTLREALRALHEDGVLARTRGAGTYVAGPPAAVANSLDKNFGVSELIAANGRTPGTRHLTIYDAQASADESEQLRIEKGAPIVIVERVRTADGRPVVFSRDAYPQSVLPGGNEDLQRLSGVSIYEFLEQYCGVTIQYGIARIIPAIAEDELAGLLDCEPGTLVLRLEQVDYDTAGTPVLYSREVHLADAFEISVMRRGPRQVPQQPR